MGWMRGVLGLYDSVGWTRGGGVLGLYDLVGWTRGGGVVPGLYDVVTRHYQWDG